MKSNNSTKIMKSIEKENTCGDKPRKTPSDGHQRFLTRQEKWDLWQDRMLNILMAIAVLLIIPIGLIGIGIILVQMFQYFMNLVA